MNASTETSVWDRTLTARIFRWAFSWRIARRCLIGLAWMVTAIALFYGEENWRGRHAWNNYRRELEARGEQLDPKAFIPKPVPDDQNFAAIPAVESWFSGGNNPTEIWGADLWMAETRISEQKFESGRGDRHFRDLVARKMGLAAVRANGKKAAAKFGPGQLDLESRSNAAPAILEALKGSESFFNTLRAASERPYSRYEVAYDMNNPWGILLPHLAQIKTCVQVLALKTSAELAGGQSAAALEDMKLALFLADSLKDEPFSISYVVRIACVSIVTSALWEGLAEGTWTKEQLDELQPLFQKFDFMAGAKTALASERSLAVLTADLLRQRKYQLGQIFDIMDWPKGSQFTTVLSFFGLNDDWQNGVLDRCIPQGWYYLEEVNYFKYYHALIEPMLDVEKRRIHPEPLNGGEGILGTLPENFEVPQLPTRGTASDIIHHRLFAKLLLPALASVPRRAAGGQVTADQAALACALERYHLASGQYPESLDALTPQFISPLPHDVLTGEPYKYRRTSEGRFVLYSVGWNGKDDRGRPGKRLFDDDAGDWVWRYTEF